MIRVRAYSRAGKLFFNDCITGKELRIRRWGIKTAREYARIKIDGLRLVGGNPDFTNAPGHGDDDARFYDRQQAYVHAPDTPPGALAPKPELTIVIFQGGPFPPVPAP